MYLNMSLLFASAIIAIVLLLLFISVKTRDTTSPQERAGQYGEIIVSDILRQALIDSDILLTNVTISYDGRVAELDNVIINEYGVFIVEAKNYAGMLYGTEDDYEWEKHKTTPAGNTYIKTVKNPIKQVKRQVYLLAKYLKSYGFDIWIDGYVILLRDNSPISSEYILSYNDNLFNVFHTRKRNNLNKTIISQIGNLLNNKI